MVAEETANVNPEAAWPNWSLVSCSLSARASCWAVISSSAASRSASPSSISRFASASSPFTLAKMRLFTSSILSSESLTSAVCCTAPASDTSATPSTRSSLGTSVSTAKSDSS